MFYYISFLRPPASSLPPGAPVTFTPQVANDLRTELYQGECDLSYTWLEVSTEANQLSLLTSPHGNGMNLTKPTKFTTWRPSNLYKELRIPPPPRVREGQKWRLILSSPRITRNSQTGLTIQLRQNDKSSLGQGPFPVISMPILFISGSGKSGGAKQERVERVYSLRGAGNDVVGETDLPATLRVLEQTSFDLDKKIWDSGIGLSSWIVDLLHLDAPSTEPRLAPLRDALFSRETKKVLELGTGTGVVSLVLAAARAALLSEEDNRAELYATDLPSALPLLEHNIELNIPTCFPNQPPIALELDWDKDLPDIVSNSGGFDLILMADITYNTASFPSLIKTLDALLNLSIRQETAPDAKVDRTNPLILLGYKERDEAERTLWDMAQEIGISFELIGKREGAGGLPVEIWLGRVERTIKVT